MKMHPEFNLGSIISKISISDIKHRGLAGHAEQPQPDFLTSLDKALAHQADSPVATAIATLNKGGMDLPDSDDYIAYVNPLDSDLRMMFETVKLLNGRSVLTTRISVQPFAASPPPVSLVGSSMTSDISIELAATAAQALSAEHLSLAPLGKTSDQLNQATAQSKSESLQLPDTRPASDQGALLAGAMSLQAIASSALSLAAPLAVTDLTPITTSSLVTSEKIATSTEPLLAAANANPVTPAISAAPVAVNNLTPTAPIATSTEPLLAAANANPVTPAISTAPVAVNNLTPTTPVITATSALPRAAAVNFVPAAATTASDMAIPVMPEIQSAPVAEAIRAALVSALDDNNLANAGREAVKPKSWQQSGLTRSVTQVAEYNTKPEDTGSEAGSDEALWQSISAETQQRSAKLATKRNSEASLLADTLALRTPAMPPPADTRLLGDAAAQPTDISPVQPPASLIHSGSAVLISETESTPSRFTERWMAYDELSRNLNSVIHRAVMERDSDGMARMRIFLTPENMGTIEAEVVEGNNRITVNLLVQNEDVAKLLRDSSSALRELLSGSGMSEVNVTIANESEAKQAQYRPPTESSGDALRGTTDEAKSEQPIATSTVDGSIDTYV